MNINEFGKLLISKRELLTCILLTLMTQIIITGSVMYQFNVEENKNSRNSFVDVLSNYKKSNPYTSTFLIFIVSIILLFAMLSKNMSFAFRFILFAIFSIIQGVLLGFTTEFLPQKVIAAALGSTFTIFLSLLMLGFIVSFFKINLSLLGMFLYMGLLGLIVFQVMSIFMPTSKPVYKIFTYLGLMIFSLFILYDTNQILLKYKNKGVDCIRGAIDYYLDIVNIFLYSLRE